MATAPQKRPAKGPAPEQLLDVRGLAELLRATPKSIRRWRSEGRLPSVVELGGVIRWQRRTIERWLAEREGQRP